MWMALTTAGTVATTATISVAEWFLAGATAAISLYTGTKVPRNRRRPR